MDTEDTCGQWIQRYSGCTQLKISEFSADPCKNSQFQAWLQSNKKQLLNYKIVEFHFILQDFTGNVSLPDGTWEVEFSRNQLTELKKNELESLWPKDYSIRAIDFSRNSIKSVEQNSFELLSSLEVLDISRNNLTELPEKVFEKLVRLQTLILSYNHLQIIRKEWFKDLTRLIRLDLSYNPLGKFFTIVTLFWAGVQATNQK